MPTWLSRVLPMWKTRDRLDKVRQDTAQSEARLAGLRAQRAAVERTRAVISTALEQNGFARLFRDSI